MKNPLLRRALVAALMMSVAAVAAHRLVPTDYIADERAKVELDTEVPTAFGDWRLVPNAVNVVTSPDEQVVLDRLYNQLLTRTYVNSQGRIVMLSIAYGRDQRQRSGLEAHHPEVCYPAQGFEVTSNVAGTLRLDSGAIPIRRLETHLRGERYEPVTYWLTVGDHATLGGADRRMAEMRYAFRGQIPDGLLFRVSSIGPDSARQFELQAGFVQALLAHVSPPVLAQLAGISQSRAGLSAS
jgi:EpsI family protein